MPTCHCYRIKSEACLIPSIHLIPDFHYLTNDSIPLDFLNSFVIYRIRNRYLQSIKDGVGERLITVNPTTLNAPGFRNAGWGNPAEIRRTHSPPIPVGASTEYFAAAPKSAGEPPSVYNDGEDDPSKAFGHIISQDSLELAPDRVVRGERIPRRRLRDGMQREEEDDTSDASDETEEEETVAQGVSNHLKFVKRPLRTRSGSSPIRSGPQVMVTSPSYKPRDSRTRAGSHGTFDLGRSSGLDRDRVSSDLIRPTVRHGRNQSNSSIEPDDSLLSTRVRDTDDKFKALTERLHRSPSSSYPKHEELNFEFPDDSGDDSDASTTLSSDFTETADSNPHGIGHALSSPMPIGLASPSVLHALPPARPISQIQPVSILSQMLKASAEKEGNPMEAYSTVSGKGELSQLILKIYIQNSKEPRKPIQVICRRVIAGENNVPRELAVHEAIGFTLFRYIEEKREPPLKEEQCDINHWALRMHEEDGEPDEDFPRGYLNPTNMKQLNLTQK